MRGGLVGEESGRRDDRAIFELRRRAARVTAAVVLVGGLGTVVAGAVAADPLPVPVSYQLGSLALIALPCVPLFLRGSRPGPLFEWSSTTLMVVMVTSSVLTVWMSPSGEAALAFLALELVACAHVLRLRASVLVFVVSTVIATIGIGAGGSDRNEWWTLLAVAAIGAVAIVGVRAQRRALASESHARRQAVAATAAVEAIVEAVSSTSTLDQDTVIEAVVAATARLGADLGGVTLVDGAGNLVAAARRGIPSDVPGALPADQGLAGDVLRRRRTVVVEDYATYPEALPHFLELGIGAAVGTPLVLADGTILGVLVMGRTTPGPFPATTVGALELLADHTARALQASRDVVADRQLLAALQAVHAQQSDFVATVSHELRTPLTVIQGMTSTLLARGDLLDDAIRQQMLERVEDNTAVLGSIIEALLDTARLDGGLRLTATEVTLVDLATDAVARMGALSAEHQLVLEADAPGVVLADRLLLERVLDNLLSNAIRHTPAGTTVTVRVEQDGGRVRVLVVDDGPGIPPALLPRVTDRFVRGGDHHTRETRGLGIGLALVQEVLQLHGSRLEVESPRGGGATFRFSLPLVGHRRRIARRTKDVELLGPA